MQDKVKVLASREVECEGAHSLRLIGAAATRAVFGDTYQCDAGTVVQDWDNNQHFNVVHEQIFNSDVVFTTADCNPVDESLDPINATDKALDTLFTSEQLATACRTGGASIDRAVTEVLQQGDALYQQSLTLSQNSHMVTDSHVANSKSPNVPIGNSNTIGGASNALPGQLLGRPIAAVVATLSLIIVVFLAYLAWETRRVLACGASSNVDNRAPSADQEGVEPRARDIETSLSTYTLLSGEDAEDAVDGDTEEAALASAPL